MENSNTIIEQFNTLNNTGMLPELDVLRQENKILHRLIEDSRELLMLTTADEMIEYVSSKFLDYFIPEFMVFLIRPPREQSLIQYCFKNIGRVDEWMDEIDFSTLKLYFEQENTSNFFDIILKKEGESAFSQKLLDKKPLLVFPLKGIGGIFGITLFCRKLVSGDYTQSEVNYIHNLFGVLSVVIQNDLHYHSSITDPKTGLYTYDYFSQEVESTIASVKRYGIPAGLLMLDIDFFKKFNDEWGHLAGDKLLVAISSSLSSILRKEDCLCRFGGEEFAILIPNTNPEGLYAVAERLRLAVKNTIITINGNELSATISVGAYLMTPDEILTTKRVFDWADKALYVSKNSGRNKSTLFPDGLLRRAEIHRSSLDN